MNEAYKPSNCMDCPHKKVIADPDPSDWFCDDDEALVCTLTPNPKQDPSSNYQSNRNAFRSVTCSCRPYRLRQESNSPDWCPLIDPRQQESTK